MNNHINKKTTPPRLVSWLLAKMVDKTTMYTAMGDYEEDFNHILREKGYFHAAAKYWLLIVTVLPSYISNTIFRSIAMLRNYFKVTFRNLLRHKAYSFINISGLAVGMACCILILLYVQDELSYDRFHENADRIYRIATEGDIGGRVDYYAGVSPSVPIAMAKEFPEIESYARLYAAPNDIITYEGKRFSETGLYMSDQSFFEMFTYEFISGQAEGALTEPNDIVLTESMAIKIFGETDVAGRTFTLGVEGGFISGDYKVSGVIKNVPQNSHFKFNYMLSLTAAPPPFQQFLGNNWISIGGYAYVMLHEGADAAQLELKFPEFIERNAGEIHRRAGVKERLFLQKVTDIHLKSHIRMELEANGSELYVYLFLAIAFLVLFIACVNFMNLSTARSSARAKEVGMRKVFGAYKKQLVYQFLGESVFVSFTGLVLALLIVFAILPAFNELAGKSLRIASMNNGLIIGGLFGIMGVAGLLAGSYPAFFLSAFQPLRVLKGMFNVRGRDSGLRKVMVVVQFSISIILIVSTMTVYSQLNYIKNKDLGYNKEQLVVVPIPGTVSRQNMLDFKRTLDGYANILSASISSSIPGKFVQGRIMYEEGKNENDVVSSKIIFVDENFIETLGMEIVEGRDFSSEFTSDSANAFIINEKAVVDFGWVDSPIGKRIKTTTNDTIVGNVVGIVKNFHLRAINETMGPIILRVRDAQRFFGGFVSVKVNPVDIPETLAFIEEKWNAVEPNIDFNSYFFDEDFARQFASEERLGRAYSYFAALAIIIACLGLFGLASFTAEQRAKEISIRKVLGASVRSIVLQLSKDFTKWILAANVFAWPAAYYLMRSWIGNFTYQVEMHIWMFVVSGFVSFLIALLTISYQSLKAAVANPAQTLRNQ